MLLAPSCCVPLRRVARRPRQASLWGGKPLCAPTRPPARDSVTMSEHRAYTSNARKTPQEPRQVPALHVDAAHAQALPVAPQ